MKKLIFSTLVGSLLALAGCQQNEEIMDNSNTSGEKVTVTANIKGSTNGRVALTPDTEEIEGTGTVPIVKVDWRTSGNPETFLVFNGTNFDTFTQVEGSNRFTGTLTTGSPVMALYNYTITNSRANYDLSAQNGTLDEKNVVMLGVPEEDENGAYTFSFEHETFILKPTFKINGSGVNSTISQIVMGNLSNINSADVNVTAITVDRSTTQENIYIFVPDNEAYEAGYEWSFEVIVNGQEYEGTYTLNNALSNGYLYTAEVTLTEVVTSTPYVTFSAESAQTFKIQPYSNYQYIDDGISGLYFSTDNGNNWTEYSESVAIDNGVEFGNGTDLLLKGNLTNGTNSAKIKFGNDDVDVTCSGDIRTLQAGESYASVTTCGNFNSLFKDCKALVSAEDLVLPAQTLVESCYESMFQSCSNLTTPPELPATTLANNCYKYMFRDCTSLTTAPELEANTLANYCYNMMFWGCTSLATAPDLPATNLADYCYQYMFYLCTNLTTVPEELPAETLTTNCYLQMFYGCSELTTAPVLPAQTLVENCYKGMFKSCSKLNSITMLATNISASECLINWVDGVAAEGVVYNNSFNESQLGLPSGWEVQSLP